MTQAEQLLCDFYIQNRRYRLMLKMKGSFDGTPEEAIALETDTQELYYQLGETREKVKKYLLENGFIKKDTIGPSARVSYLRRNR